MMRQTMGFAAAIAATAAVVAVPDTAAAVELLRCRDVAFAVDRDIIKVGRSYGRYRAIKFTVSGNPIEVFNIRVVYGNGTPDDLSVRSVINAGGETRWIDLRGRDRAIDYIEFIYRSIPAYRGQALVCAYGY